MTGPARRTTAAALLSTTLAVVIALAAMAGPCLLVAAPAAAAPGPRAPAPSSTTTVAGKGSMDAEEITLSGTTVTRSTPGSTSAPGERAAPAPGAPGWSTVLTLAPGTQMVALSWDGGSTPGGPAAGRMSLRHRRDARPWTEWLALAPEPGDGDGEGTGRVGSDLVWLGSAGADQVEVRIDAGPLPGLELLRMRYRQGAPRIVTTDAAPDATARAAAGTPQPTVRPRRDWASGGWRSTNPGCGPAPSVASRLDHAVVHHTATSNSYTAAQVPGLIDGIYRYHTASLGWCDIAYNFVVDKYGTIWHGRSGDITQPVVGGHARGFNTNSVGVTLLGQFEPGASPASASPTSVMLDSAARLLAWKLSLHGLDPNGEVTVTSGGSTRYAAGVQVTLPVINPHQATGTTSCPGANVMARLGALRTATAGYTEAAPPADAPWAPFESAEAFVYRQYFDFLRHPGTWDDRRSWSQDIAAGTVNPAALPVALLRSTQLQADSASVVRLYRAYFGRVPDHDGVRYWWSVMDRTHSLRGVSASFAASAEFRNQYGSLSNAAFVDLVYRNVLGRPPDAGGAAYWTQRLDAGGESRGGLMTLFSESPENVTNTVDVVAVIVTHEVMLGRPIGATALTSWADRVHDDPTVLITQLLGSDEYAARFV